MYIFLKKIHWIIQAQIGIDLRKIFRFFQALPKFLYDYIRFRSAYKGKIEIVPCLHDLNEEGGVTKNEYFWQDLIVAQKIYTQQPLKHVDIGSRVDGFVAHVASFRNIEVFDVRPIESSIPGVIFRHADLMQSTDKFNEYCDSLSCLHALEHFGLGRYGDPLNVHGFRLGLMSMASMVKVGGLFYLSVPIGLERVAFNANWIFDPRSIISVATESSLVIKELSLISQNGVVECNFNNNLELLKLAQSRYTLGLFCFLKVKKVNNK